MELLKQSVLDKWIEEKYFADLGWSREKLEQWQMERIREVVKLAKRRSSFYQKMYEGMPLPEELEVFQQFPVMDSGIVKRDGGKLLCVSQREIARAVTLETSGTLDRPKRLFFTEEDQELTIDFFAHGMRELASAGETVAVCLPFQTPGCVGDLLIRGLARQKVHSIGVGIIKELREAADMIIGSGAQVIVGVPIQLLGLMEYADCHDIKLPLQRALTSTDNLPKNVRTRLERLGLEVFDHFGMTECGLGGALECGVHQGMHIRENDLFMEIVDKDGSSVPDGSFGELVITTLTRRGMPLIRYRTGDCGRILQGRCSCGSVLRRLEVAGRLEEQSFLGKTIREWDAYLLNYDQIIDYCIAQRGGSWSVTIYSFSEVPGHMKRDIAERLGGKAGVSYQRITDCLPKYYGKRTLGGV